MSKTGDWTDEDESEINALLPTAKDIFIEGLIHEWDTKEMVVDLGALDTFCNPLATPFLSPLTNIETWIDDQPWGSILDALDWYDCAVFDLNESAADAEDEEFLDFLEEAEKIIDKLREMLRSLFEFDYQCSNNDRKKYISKTWKRLMPKPLQNALLFRLKEPP